MATSADGLSANWTTVGSFCSVTALLPNVGVHPLGRSFGANGGRTGAGCTYSPNPSCATREKPLGPHGYAACFASFPNRIQLHAAGGWNPRSNTGFDGLGECLPLPSTKPKSIRGLRFRHPIVLSKRFGETDRGGEAPLRDYRAAVGRSGDPGFGRRASGHRGASRRGRAPAKRELGGCGRGPAGRVGHRSTPAGSAARGCPAPCRPPSAQKGALSGSE